MTWRRTRLIFCPRTANCALNSSRPGRPIPVMVTRSVTTQAGSGVVLINQTPQTQNELEVSEPCFWWRRGRVGCSQFAKTVGTPISRQDSGACERRSATPGLKDVDYPCCSILSATKLEHPVRRTSCKLYLRASTLLSTGGGFGCKLVAKGMHKIV